MAETMQNLVEETVEETVDEMIEEQTENEAEDPLKAAIESQMKKIQQQLRFTSFPAAAGSSTSSLKFSAMNLLRPV